MSYQALVTSDPAGALKTILSTSVGLIPEIGPFLALGINLFFPTEKSNTYYLIEKLKDEMQREIYQELEQENTKLLEIGVSDASTPWHTFVTKDFLPVVAPSFLNSPDTFPTLNLHQIGQYGKGTGNQLVILYTNLGYAKSSCESKKGIPKIASPSYKKIAEVILFGSFHIAAVSHMISVKKFIQENYPDEYNSTSFQTNPYFDVGTTELKYLKKYYSKLLRNCVAHLSEQSKIIAQSNTDDLVFTYQPTPISSIQKVSSGGGSWALGLYKKRDEYLLENYRRIRKCPIYIFIAKNVLPVLFHWEHGLEASDITKTSLNPDIPFPVKPAIDIPSFSPYLYEKKLTAVRNITYDESNPHKHDYASMKEYDNSNFSSDTQNFEECTWLQWGNSDQPCPEFDVMIQDPETGDSPAFTNLSAGSLTTTPYDGEYDAYYSGEEETTKGYYIKAVDDDKSGKYGMDIFLASPTKVAYKYDLHQFLGSQYLNNRFQVPLNGTPAAEDIVGKGNQQIIHSRKIFTNPVFSRVTTNYKFTSIPTNNPWGAKIFDKVYGTNPSIDLWCNPVNWYYAPGNNSEVTTPFQLEYAQLNPAFRFPNALKFSLVIYQIDTVDKLIYYYPVSTKKMAYKLNPDIPIYVAVNDAISYKDNRGLVSISVETQVIEKV